MRAASAGPAIRELDLYGIVPASAATGDVVSGLPADVEFVPYRLIAALVRPAPANDAKRLRVSLLEYAGILDRMAATGPVLPVRFGTRFADRSAVARRVLVDGYEVCERALAELAGTAQYTVRARYHEDIAVREVLAERPELVRLHQRVHRQAGGARAAPGRLELGQAVAGAVDRKRATDAALVVEAVSTHARAVAVPPLPAGDADRLADVACLVERDRAAPLEAAVGDLAHRWRERARLRLLGPMAPYHFVADLFAGAPVGCRPARPGRRPPWAS